MESNAVLNAMGNNKNQMNNNIISNINDINNPIEEARKKLTNIKYNNLK